MKMQTQPFIQQNYRVDPAQRTFHGASAGGYFGAYVLFAATNRWHCVALGV